MSRNSIFMICLVAVLVMGLFFGNGKVEAAKYNWKFALEEVEGSVQDEWAQEFKRRIEERSDGEINIEIYPYGALGTSEDITELTQNGVLEFTFASPGHLASFIPEVGLFSLHFLWSDNMEVNKEVMANSKAIYGLLADRYEESNLKLLEVNHEGWQVWTANKPLRTPADFKGFKMRVMGDPILIADYQAYGANPVQVAYSEIYSALQLNMIDGNIQPLFAHQEMKFYEQQDYFTYAQQVPFITTVVANKQFFASLPAEYQKMIQDISLELVDYIFAVQDKLNKERLEMMLEAKPGLEVIYLTEEEREAFKELAMPVWDDFVKDAGGDSSIILGTLLEEIKAAEKKHE